MKIERYTSHNTRPLIAVMYKAVHAICITLYNKEQLQAWAPDLMLREAINLNKVWTCRIENVIVGYIDFIETKGYINHLYIHPDYQKKGIGSMLYEAVLDDARILNIETLEVDASKVALPFFLNKGFILEKENIVERNGVKLINFTLSKNIL